MKKRLLSLITSLFMVISMVSVLPALTASAATYGDYEYEILSDGTVEITGYEGSASTLSISSTINGKKVTSIGESAFYWCDSLKSVIIPNSVKSIGDGAFENCFSLSSITIPNSVTSIGDDAFDDCTNLTSITIPNSVTSIGDWAFNACGSLTSITIPNSVTSIGDYAFYGCDSLTSVIIPNSVTCIGDGVFFCCTSLTRITIPNSVTSIGDWAFNACGSLTSITIPNSVTSIGDYAFGYNYLFEEDEYIKISNFKINCYSGTAGDKYAKDNGFSYELIDAPSNADTKLPAFGTPYTTSINETSAYIKCNISENGSNWSEVGAYYGTTTACSTKAGSDNLAHGSSWAGYALSNLSGGTTYYYKFYIKANGTTYWSSVQSFTISHNHSYTSKVTKAATCTTAGVRTYTCSCGDSYTESIPATGHKYVDTVVAPTYTEKGYTLHKCSVCGDSYTDNYTAKLVVPTVTGFKASSTSNSIKLTNNKVSGATGYVYYRAVNGKWTKIGTAKTNSYTDKNLKAGTSYRYAVKAYKTVDSKNYYSAKYPTVWTSTLPANVSFSLSAKPTSVTIKWKTVTGASGYKVYYKTGANSKWIGLKTTNNKTTSYTASNLTFGKQYYFTVKAYRTFNNKTYNGKFNTKSIKTYYCLSSNPTSVEKKGVQVLNNIAKSNSVSFPTLRMAYNWSKMPYVHDSVAYGNGSEWFANKGLSHHYGNCYIMAGTFTVLAKLLGYNAVQISGQVRLSSGRYGPHSWVEITINNKTYLFDPDSEYELKMSYYMYTYHPVSPGSLYYVVGDGKHVKYRRLTKMKK